MPCFRRLRVPSSKGLWLSRWCGCSDPVALDWSSSWLKIFGVFIGTGNLEENNWCRRINAVARVLRSWRSRSLSYRGKALVVHSSICPKELSCLSFSFFWSGKRHLVSCSRVVQSPLFDGFPVVDVNLKVWSLLSQWIRGLPLLPPVGYPSCLTGSSRHLMLHPSRSFHVLIPLILGSCPPSISLFCLPRLVIFCISHLTRLQLVVPPCLLPGFRFVIQTLIIASPP